MQLPIGTSDFKKIIDQQFDFVDKTLFIKEVIEDVEAILITRPRRFGKTLNMSMLRYFLDIRESAAYLFENLKIKKEKTLWEAHQGQYPVIYLTFKDIKSSSFDEAYQKIKLIIQSAYDQHSLVLLKSDKLTAFQKRRINAILDDGVSQSEVEESLLTLSKCLHDHYGKKVCILLDEYDTPIQAGYLKSYYDEVAGFFRNYWGLR